MKQKKSFTIALSAIFCLAAVTVQAQKLPNVQKTSIYAPGNVKVDGKPTEWDDKFEAQNNATSLYYTMANDDKNLYLTVQAVDAPTINKVIRGGLKLTINGAEKTDGQVIVAGMLVQQGGRMFFTKSLFEDNVEAHNRIDEFNVQMDNKFKEIGVIGIKDIEDTLISAYNEYGIKQAAKLDTKGTLTCEMAIPLKYISNLIIDGAFTYNIKLPGENNPMTAMMNAMPATLRDGSTLIATTNVITSMKINGVDVTNDIQGMYNPTDLSGTYVLAKK